MLASVSFTPAYITAATVSRLGLVIEAALSSLLKAAPRRYGIHFDSLGSS